jgi:hypothetical protein
MGLGHLDQRGNLLQGGFVALMAEGLDDHVVWTFGEQGGQPSLMFQGGAMDDQSAQAEAAAFLE